ncbi:antitoxin VbhA family protein, partial [Escherichia coli]|uniref:antitoxin VbhA family protein n=1 Tax=Escherichia coli TaxID=562 RepID=UPI00385DD543
NTRVDNYLRNNSFPSMIQAFTVSTPPLYEGIKQRIIAGEITYEQGRAEIFEYHAQRAKQHQA